VIIVADVIFVVLTIALFALLALAIRGAERL
jgi:nitrate reductase NapE component